jgi:hypothetical protein
VYIFLVQGRDKCSHGIARSFAARPRPKLRPNKRLDSFSPGQPPAEPVAFTLNSNCDIEKGAACVFQRRDLCQRGVRCSFPWKFKVITAGQFADRAERRLQQRCQFMMSCSLHVGQRCHVAKKWCRAAHFVEGDKRTTLPVTTSAPQPPGSARAADH